MADGGARLGAQMVDSPVVDSPVVDSGAEVPGWLPLRPA
jgi:hypothetical protein